MTRFRLATPVACADCLTRDLGLEWESWHPGHRTQRLMYLSPQDCQSSQGRASPSMVGKNEWLTENRKAVAGKKDAQHTQRRAEKKQQGLRESSDSLSDCPDSGPLESLSFEKQKGLCWCRKG